MTSESEHLPPFCFLEVCQAFAWPLRTLELGVARPDHSVYGCIWERFFFINIFQHASIAPIQFCEWVIFSHVGEKAHPRSTNTHKTRKWKMWIASNQNNSNNQWRFSQNWLINHTPLTWWIYCAQVQIFRELIPFSTSFMTAVVSAKWLRTLVCAFLCKYLHQSGRRRFVCRKRLSLLCHRH